MSAARFSSRRARSRVVSSESCLAPWLLAGAALASALVLPRLARGQEVTPTGSQPLGTPPSIVVSARGEAAASPDQARINFWVETRATTAADAARENARLADQVIRAIRGAGIAPRDLSTSGYSLVAEQQYDERERRPRVVGYVARNGVNVLVRDIAQVGQLIDLAIQAGANGVGNLSFESSQAAELQRSALTMAVGTACRDAEVMARAAGGSLGRLLELTSSQAMYPPPQPVYRMAAAEMARDVSTPIEPGELTHVAMVTARWEFVAAPAGQGTRCQ